MDTKAAFERWWKDRNDGDSRFEMSLHSGYVADDIEEAWCIWKASRAAIEIELPNPEDYHCSGSAEAALIDVSAAITSHGIRIKGKTE